MSFRTRASVSARRSLTLVRFSRLSAERERLLLSFRRAALLFFVVMSLSLIVVVARYVTGIVARQSLVPLRSRSACRRADGADTGELRFSGTTSLETVTSGHASKTGPSNSAAPRDDGTGPDGGSRCGSIACRPRGPCVLRGGDFSDGATDAKLANLVSFFVANIACLKDHLKACARHTTSHSMATRLSTPAEMLASSTTCGIATSTSISSSLVPACFQKSQHFSRARLSTQAKVGSWIAMTLAPSHWTAAELTAMAT